MSTISIKNNSMKKETKEYFLYSLTKLGIGAIPTVGAIASELLQIIVNATTQKLLFQKN